MRRPLKQIVLAAKILFFVTIAIHIISALTLDRMIAYTEVSFSSSDIRPELDGYVIAFITDTHALSKTKLEKVVTRLNTRRVDLLLLGGDFPSRGEAPLRSMSVLGQTKTVDGIFGVDGNHDKSWELFPAMENHGIQPLDNVGLYLRPGFYLAGVADLWYRKPDVGKAVQNADAKDFVLLVSHNPDVSMQQDTSKVDLMLSGHTHGGHITLFGLWAPALWPMKDISKYGQKFKSGWTLAQYGTNVYVSRGTGPLETAPRIFARPQVIFITLKSQ